MKITERIHNAQTGEIIDIEREETKTEIEDRLASKLRIENMLNKTATKQAAKALLLEKLGITEEEADTLVI
jgi:hypothetical protein